MPHDLRYALRTLRKSPAFTFATVLTLALAIGANSAMFSVVDALLLKPLPIDPANRLVGIFERTPVTDREYVPQPDLDDWRAMAHSFTGLASWVPQSVNLTGLDRPERVVGIFASSNFFTVLNVRPALGRNFASGEDRPGGVRVAIITAGLWRSHFGADPAVLGKTADFNGEPYTIVGVLPASFVFPYADADVYLPAFKYPNYTLDRAKTSCAVIARLRDGVSLAAAQSEMDAVAARLAASYPATNDGRGAAVVPLRDDMVDHLRPTLIALTGAVAFVLLIACANAAGLMIARLLARQRERAIRVALGASRARLLSHTLAEAGLLAVAGGGLGIVLAVWAIPAIAAGIADFLPYGTAALALDRTALLFTAAATLASSLLVGLIPAWQGGSLAGLRESRGAGAAAARNRARGVLVVAEIALALVLLVGAGLMVESLAALGRTDPGFDTQHLLTMAYRVPGSQYSTGAQQVRFHDEVVARIKALPGVVDATSVRWVPLGGNLGSTEFLMTDRPEPPPAKRPRSQVNFADPNFFATMRIPVRRGRVFTNRDRAGAPYVIVVNETLARRYFGDRDPVGRQLRLPDLHQTAEIVGVVGDVKQSTLTAPPAPQIYGALAQNPFVFTSIAVRTAGDPLAMADSVRRAIWQVDKDQPVWSIHDYGQIFANQSRLRRLVTATLGGYAAVALLLACIGIFGLVSYAVGQRAGEIGVRMALGARPGDVLKLVLRQGLSLVMFGIVAGTAAAAWLSRYLQSQLYGVSRLNPAVYAAVAALLAAVALAACLVPARRAMRVDPVQALRQE